MDCRTLRTLHVYKLNLKLTNNYHISLFDFLSFSGGSRSMNRFLRPYVCPFVPARQYLLSAICNSNSFQSILFKLCSVCIHIEDMHLLLWADLKIFSYIFCMLSLVIFYHYMSWTVPSWCNLKLQQCSINIIQTLHSVCIHIEDVHLLLWADLKKKFL
jgi:hypothetical protein